jgi:hypothetical protein
MLLQARPDLLIQLFSGAEDLPRYLHCKLSGTSAIRNVDPSDPPAPEPPWCSQKVQWTKSIAWETFSGDDGGITFTKSYRIEMNDDISSEEFMRD